MDDPIKQRVLQGIEACQRGDYRLARRELEGAASALGDASKLASRALAAYGLALAGTGGKTAVATGFCKAAMEKDPTEGEAHYALARIYLLAGSKKKAAQAVEDGRRADPYHPGLQKLHAQIGVRSRPPVPFLDRGHPINRALGKLRQAMKGSSKAAPKKRAR